MGALTRIAIPAVLVACACVAGVLLLGRRISEPDVVPAKPIAVHATLAPPTAQFGDRVAGRVIVLLDREVVRPGTLRVTHDLARLTGVAPARTARTTRGRLAVVTVELRAACLTDRCVTRLGDTTLALPRVTAEVSGRDHAVFRAQTAWPPLLVRGRVTAKDLALVKPPFRADTSLRAPSYRIPPSTLAAFLEVLAAVLAVAGVALVAYHAALLVRGRSRARPTAGELEQALRYARQAELRPAADRRRALGLLARLLDRRDHRLARAASTLAWSRPKPEPGALSELVAEVEREVPS